MNFRQAFFYWLVGAAVALGLSVLAALLDLPDDAALDAATQASVQDAIERAQALESMRALTLAEGPMANEEEGLE